MEYRGFLAGPSGGSELVPQLRHLNEIGFNASLTALISKSLRKMCLTGSGWANECQVPVGIDGRQGRQRFQPAGISPLYDREIEVFKGFGIFQRETTHFQQRMDGSIHFLSL